MTSQIQSLFFAASAASLFLSDTFSIDEKVSKKSSRDKVAFATKAANPSVFLSRALLCSYCAISHRTNLSCNRHRDLI
jgi:hypothetical protein